MQNSSTKRSSELKSKENGKSCDFKTPYARNKEKRLKSVLENNEELRNLQHDTIALLQTVHSAISSANSISTLKQHVTLTNHISSHSGLEDTLSSQTSNDKNACPVFTPRSSHKEINMNRSGSMSQIDVQTGTSPIKDNKSKDNLDGKFSFINEENRVQRGADIFRPDVIASKQRLLAQQSALAQEYARLNRISELESKEYARKYQMTQLGKIQDRMNYSATVIQARVRGFICRHYLRQQRQMVIKPGGTNLPWYEIHDHNKGEVWFYNAHTKNSQWQRPPELYTASMPAVLPELSKTPRSTPTTPSKDPNHLLESANTVSLGFPMLHSSKSSLVLGQALTEPQISIEREEIHLPELLPSSSSKIPNPENRKPFNNLAIPWDCESYRSDDTSSIRDRFSPRSSIADESRESPSYFRSEGKQRQALHKNIGPPNEDECSWLAQDSLFLADGTRNSRLRDTIRNALHLSKFDSVTSLIASINRKESSRNLQKNHHEESNNRQELQRDVVYGRKEQPFIVSKVRNQLSPSKITQKKSTTDHFLLSGQKKSMRCRLGPKIRDLNDPGFELDLGLQSTPQNNNSSYANIKSEESKNSPVICFNCWSSSTGANCDAHQDPMRANRKIKSGASHLICANWNSEHLRKKYRAEEIQEVFRKQNASLRFDINLKKYVTVIECKHPIYRRIAQHLTAWNKAMRRKLHTRGWFRSFIEHLRSGRVLMANTKVPSLLRIKATLQHNKWCLSYADRVREFEPRAPITIRDESGQYPPVKDTIMIHPNARQLCHWILVTEYAKPKELYKPRVYELPPRRCVPMPALNVQHENPIPLPNVWITCTDRVSWFERLASRVSIAAFHKAITQIQACSPPTGYLDARRTKHTRPLIVTFATFGRKSTKGNIAIGGLTAEVLIHMLVTTYIPAQFGNFIVLDRASVSPQPASENLKLSIVDVETKSQEFVFRPLEHALNTRRPPCIVIATVQKDYISEDHSTSNHTLTQLNYPQNRPEQTGEESFHGFRTVVETIANFVPTTIEPLTFEPGDSILSPNSPSVNSTVTTKATRNYPFCVPTTKEYTSIEFMHLLWIGKSSRNQPQTFTALGSQQPGEFMKHSNPNGEIGTCLCTIYRSWLYLQSSPFQEFATDEGIAYWYDKRSGETFWSKPILPAEQYRGQDGDIHGTEAHGFGEVASVGVGVELPKYTQADMRKFITKRMELDAEKERRLKDVKTSTRKHDIQLQLSYDDEETNVIREDKNLVKRQQLEKISVPKLPIHNTKQINMRNEARSSKVNSHSSFCKDESNSAHNIDGAHETGLAILDDGTKSLILSITQALGAANKNSNETNDKGMRSEIDLIQLGIGLGMGLGLRKQQEENATESTIKLGNNTTSATQAEVSFRSDISETELEMTDTLRSNNESDVMTTDRSQMSSITSLEITPSPDEITQTPGKQDDLEASNNHLIIKRAPGFKMHAPPGEGRLWSTKPMDDSSNSQSSVSELNGTVHLRVGCIPLGFFPSISSTKVCPMQASFLPVIKNVNQPQCVGILKPLKVQKEWDTIGYSPWSAGRAILNTQFIGDLILRPELISSNDQVQSASTMESFGSTHALHSIKNTGQSEIITKAMKEARDLSLLFSLCRHGHYEEIEEHLSSPDWTLPIDAKDATGNTLLSIACQNNNKRIAKLCLRRGADINTQNLNGQTVLHYCHEYGFHDLMEYLMDKGAQDDIPNAEGFTCYEGLNKAAVDSI